MAMVSHVAMHSKPGTSAVIGSTTVSSSAPMRAPMPSSLGKHCHARRTRAVTNLVRVRVRLRVRLRLRLRLRLRVKGKVRVRCSAGGAQRGAVVLRRVGDDEVLAWLGLG